MNRTSLLGLTLALPALGAAFFACQKEDPRPPVSDGPGVFNPNGGGGSGNDGGASGDGGSNAFVSFPGYQASGVALDGDTAYVTLIAHDTTQPGRVVRVDPSGAVTVLVSNAVEPGGPVVGNATLYYEDRTSDFKFYELMTLSLTNISAGSQSFTGGFSVPFGFAVSGDLVYLSDDFQDDGTNADLVIADAGSSSFSTLGNIPPPLDSPGAIAVDANNVYFVGSDGNTSSSLVSVPLIGGPQNPLLAANGVGVIGPIAVVNDFVYFTLQSSDPTVTGVYSVPTIGGAGARIATPAIPEGLAVSATNIYYDDYSSDPPSIYKGALTSDAGIDPILIGSARVPTEIALGATAVYVGIDEGLLRLPL